ncbi:MAG: serine/threonine-protein kinase [Acidobacteriota bacterium]
MLESDELGVSYRAWDTVKERPVTLRRFTAPQSEPSKIERLLREATFAMKLQHANILTVYDVGEEAGVKYVATEYAEGQNLRARLEAGERLDPYRAADVIAQVALALDHAHRQGVVHRNLRPETILILTNGDVAKVRDFGFADRLTDTLKASGEKRNPLLYMAPEQILGKKIDERSDVYSLGTILFELLFGHPPFTGEDIIYQHVSRPVTFPRDAARIPDRLRRVVLRSLEKDPGRRFQSAREIADELRRTEVEPGTLIDARYEIQAEIGTGGMGKVYRARDRELDETVALKILKSEYGESSDALGRFLREIKLARKISHPNVVKVYDMGRFRGSRFISMELISGPSLDQWVRQRSRIDIDAALRIVKPILSALHAAHELGIVHRDVKPQNVLLHQGTIPKIVDFGIARGMNSEGVTLSGEVLGSPKYMSPEHIEEGTLDRRADVYAVGVLMYLLFSGREPFTGENPTAILLKHIHEPPKRPRALNPEVPDWLERVVMRCLEKDPERRYQWASEVLQDLEAQG